MYIGKIRLTSIRGFDRLDFSLVRPDKSHAGWTVFGISKRAVLKQIYKLEEQERLRRVGPAKGSH